MLVLTRKSGEEIRIGNDIVISLFRIQGQRARLGIEAPANVSIRRKESLFEVPKPTVQKVAQDC
jgi:carbon storage regulator